MQLGSFLLDVFNQLVISEISKLFQISSILVNVCGIFGVGLEFAIYFPSNLCKNFIMKWEKLCDTNCSSLVVF